MGRGRAIEASSALGGLRAKIARWRHGQPRTRPMPEPLWREASGAAQRYGIWRVSRELKLNYESLKKRAASSVAGRREVTSAVPQFIELQGLGRPEPDAPAQTVVELMGPDGTRLTIRLVQANPDVAGMLAAFRLRP